MHTYEVRPRKDKRGVDLISDALGGLWYAGPSAVANAIGYAQHFSRSHDAVIRVYDDVGNVIETDEHRPRSIVLSKRHGILSVEEMLAAGEAPAQKPKKGRKERQVKKLFLVAFMVSGLGFVPVQRSDAQIEIGIPGIGTGPGVNYGYPHFEYGYYPRGGYYYQQPDSGYYGGPSYYGHHGHQVHYGRKASVGPISTN